MREKNPDWFCHGAGEMGDAGVGSDDEIEGGDDRGCVGEVAITTAAIAHVNVRRKVRKLKRWFAFLQGDPVDSVDL